MFPESFARRVRICTHSQVHAVAGGSLMSRACWVGSAALVAASFLLSAWCFTFFPDVVPTHWNIRGEIDGHGSKHFSLWFSPVFMLLLMGLFAVLPALSPRGFQVDTFRGATLVILVVALALFAYLHAVILRATWLGVEGRTGFDIGRWLFGGMYGFLGLMGFFLRKIGRNFYIGVRVPWTLASERVWNETHRFTGWLWAGMAVPGIALIALGAPILYPIILFFAGALAPIVYAFIDYKQLERKGLI